MKKRIPGFWAGMVTMAVIGGVTATALAAAGSFTITVDPVNIQVNGQVFAPKDVKGNDVPVFAYNGTTYAPLRALGEAYGLSVGYDGTSGLVAVTALTTPSAPPVDPEPTDPTTPPAFSWTEENEALYQEFKGMWKVVGTDDGVPPYRILDVQYQGKSTTTLKELFTVSDDSVIYEITKRYAEELFSENSDAEMLMINYFCEKTIIWKDDYTQRAQLVGGVRTNFVSGFYRDTVLSRLK